MIRARKKADGTVSYTVQIRLKNKGVLVYQECQAFARKPTAWTRFKRREIPRRANMKNAHSIQNGRS